MGVYGLYLVPSLDCTSDVQSSPLTLVSSFMCLFLTHKTQGMIKNTMRLLRLGQKPGLFAPKEVLPPTGGLGKVY